MKNASAASVDEETAAPRVFRRMWNARAALERSGAARRQ